MRILVVDDNRDSAESLAALLEIGGHHIQIAYDGAEAVEKAAAFGPQLVLLDVGLPKMNGYDACRAMRGLPEGGRMAIVALTGWAREDDRIKAIEAGFTRHLVKPVDFDELEALVKALNGREMYLHRAD